MTGPVHESDALDLKITATIQFDFGSICDRIEATRDSVEPLCKKIIDLFMGTARPADCFTNDLRDILIEHNEKQIKALTRFTRDKGNSSIRVIRNHLKHVKIARRHNRDSINVERVIHTHEKGDSHGD